jgi:hypothetical protein
MLSARPTIRLVEEVAPGIWHWSARHPRIRIRVHSYYLPAERVVIDPLVRRSELDWLAEHGPPTDVLLTNRHHYRSSGELAERFGARVRCVREGMHEFRRGEPVEPFEFGDEVVEGVVGYEVGALCPDETALFVPARRALALADGAIRWRAGGPLAFVPDRFMDEPEKTKAGLRAAYRRLAQDRDFDHLLLAHGEPFVGNGREALRAFAEGR